MDNTVDAVSILKDSPIVLGVIKKESYPQTRIAILSSLASSFSKVCYLTSNMPFSKIEQELQTLDIPPERLQVIDTITKTVQQPEENEHCTFIDSPTALTDVSLAFSTAMNEQGCEAAIVDAISTFTIYQDPQAVLKLVHNLVTKLRVGGQKAIFIALQEDGEAFIKDSSLFMDRTQEF